MKTREKLSHESKEDAQDYRYFPNQIYLPDNKNELVERLKKAPRTSRCQSKDMYPSMACLNMMPRSSPPQRSYLISSRKPQNKAPMSKLSAMDYGDMLRILNERNLEIVDIIPSIIFSEAHYFNR